MPNCHLDLELPSLFGKVKDLCIPTLGTHPHLMTICLQGEGL